MELTVKTDKYKGSEKEKQDKLNWQKENRKNNPQKTRDYSAKYRTQPKTRFNNAKSNAKTRGIEFTLTFEEWLEAVEKPCIYCNNVLHKKTTTSCGLDRIDNSKGYVSGNVISCCKKCNAMKMNDLTFEETKAAAQAVMRCRMDITLDVIKMLGKLMTDCQLDEITYGPLKLTKSKHESKQSKINKPVFTEKILSDEELMFASTMAPALTQEELEALAVNPPPRKNKKDS